MDLKYLLKIFIVVFIILSLIIFINSIGLNLNDPDISKKLLKVVTIEGFDKSSPFLTGSQAFCKFNKGSNLEKACNDLTETNCNQTSCCIWSSKCMAGNASGPLFNSDAKGKTIQLPYYYFQNKCYGTTCPQ